MIPDWVQIKAKDSGSAEVLIYDEIGESDYLSESALGAKEFHAGLKALGDIANLDVRINSPGGDVFEGTAIFNVLRAHKARKTVHIDGIAASIASVIAMAGDEIVAPSNAVIMVHMPAGGVMGNAGDMRKMAEALDVVTESIIASYGRTKQTKEKLAAIMAEETWMTAEEAHELGFVDRVTSAARYAASAGTLEKLNVPDRIKAIIAKAETRAEYKPYLQVRDEVVARRIQNQKLIRLVTAAVAARNPR